MRAVAPESEIRFEPVGEVPAFDTAADAPLVARVRRHLDTGASTGTDMAPRYVGFGTEAGLFQRAGIASVLCGPGSIEQAHKPDEFVSLEQLARCERFLESLLELPSAPPGH